MARPSLPKCPAQPAARGRDGAHRRLARLCRDGAHGGRICREKPAGQGQVAVRSAARCWKKPAARASCRPCRRPSTASTSPWRWAIPRPARSRRWLNLLVPLSIYFSLQTWPNYKASLAAHLSLVKQAGGFVQLGTARVRQKFRGSSSTANPQAKRPLDT